ncbi:MAG: hypothetical protein N2322_06385 [Terrimicrobiaceae bacterium]|nr:hypothetical protein [Terrimicrobiaceae bacterium]
MPGWLRKLPGAAGAIEHRCLAPKFGENYKVGYIGFLLRAESPAASGICFFPGGLEPSRLRARRVFVVTGENRGVEAGGAKGVTEASLDRHFDDPRVLVVFRKPRKLDTATGQRIAAAALAQAGLRYDHLLAAAKLLDSSFLGRWLRSAFPEPRARFPGLLEDRDDAWVSAELAAHCLAAQPQYAEAGILARRAHPIHPQELFEDAELFAAWKTEAGPPGN